MAKRGLTLKVRIDGIFEVLRALSELPPEANKQIREKSLEISKLLETKAKASGAAEGSQAALVATTVKARKDRVPVVVAGGMKRLGRHRKPAYKLLFGSEFGANRLKQYKPHIGNGSYWFFKTVEDNREEISRRWLAAADEIVRNFGGV